MRVWEIAASRLTPEEAAEVLADLMSDISEDVWCAGWLHGLEYILWRFAEDIPDQDGDLTDITCPCYKKVLHELSERAGVWVAWNPDAFKVEEAPHRLHIPLAEWRETWEARERKEFKR